MGKIGDQFHILPVSSSMCHMSVSAGWVRLMMKQAALETSPSGICGARLSFETELNLVQRNPHQIRTAVKQSKLGSVMIE
ncbi:hypothetical protein LSH36_233g05000 [Paralvinella palmiformis]|uniref:Uncharacterized protein n=1 Tax=Paralvinella palmiformis TaxID=53620 RepID=A0AAD9N3E8_9ANNE|nr:hypothetical protein LSH36_233g05000 [Paralvinella palmiformis]